MRVVHVGAPDGFVTIVASAEDWHQVAKDLELVEGRCDLSNPGARLVGILEEPLRGLKAEGK